MSEQSEGLNPKDVIGTKKIPVGLLPGAGIILGSLAMADGAKKYQPYNWREQKIQYTIYLDAMERHILALRDGEDNATDSNVHHLGHIIAGASILADAIFGGFVVDNRPKAGPTPTMLAQLSETNNADNRRSGVKTRRMSWHAAPGAKARGCPVGSRFGLSDRRKN